MTITSYGYPGTIAPGLAWAQMQRALGRHGGVESPEYYRVIPQPGLQLLVGGGSAAKHGVLALSDAVENVTLPSVGFGSQYFLVGLDFRWNDDGNGHRTEITYVTGTANRAIPSFVDNPGTRSLLPLALVRVTAGNSTPTEVVDLRLLSGGAENNIQIFDDLALVLLQNTAGASARNVNTNIRRERVVTPGHTLAWQIQSATPRPFKASSWHDKSDKVQGVPYLDLFRFPLGDRDFPGGAPDSGSRGALVTFSCQVDFGPYWPIFPTGESGDMEDLTILWIGDPLFRPRKVHPFTFLYAASADTKMLGGHGYINPGGEVNLVSLAPRTQIRSSAHGWGLYIDTTYYNEGQN